MHLTIAKKDLLRALAHTVGAADSKSTMPCLACVLLDADGADRNAVYVAATDLYVGVSEVVPADVKTPGKVAVSARALFDRVKAMPDGPIVISAKDSNVTLKASASGRRYTMRGIPGADYPTLPELPAHSARIELPAATLAKLIDRTHFSVSTDETRAALNSLMIEAGLRKVWAVSTDGHRLSLATEVSETSWASMLLSRRALAELKKLLGEVGGDVTVTIFRSDAVAFFDVGGCRLSTKLVDATFPPYEQVIPKNPDHAATVGRAAFADALRAVSLASSDRTGGVKLEFSVGALRITGESPETGDGYDDMPAEYNGPERAIGINAGYVLDVLGALDCESVTVAFGGELDPVVIRPVGDESFTGVVMPLRIN